MEYTPDLWSIIKIELPDEVIYKVFGSWYGGYARGDSWRLNSGIVDVIEYDDYYEFKGYSGSVYSCPKSAYGWHAYSAGVIKDFQEDAVAKGGTLTVLPKDTDWATEILGR